MNIKLNEPLTQSPKPGKSTNATCSAKPSQKGAACCTTASLLNIVVHINLILQVVQCKPVLNEPVQFCCFIIFGFYYSFFCLAASCFSFIIFGCFLLASSSASSTRQCVMGGPTNILSHYHQEEAHRHGPFPQWAPSLAMPFARQGRYAGISERSPVLRFLFFFNEEVVQ